MTPNASSASQTAARLCTDPSDQEEPTKGTKQRRTVSTRNESQPSALRSVCLFRVGPARHVGM